MNTKLHNFNNFNVYLKKVRQKHNIIFTWNYI